MIASLIEDILGLILTVCAMAGERSAMEPPKVKIGDSIEITHVDGRRKMGVIQDVRHDVVTVLIAGGEGHTSVMVRPERLKPVGEKRWSLEM
jgi:hypothetical protein